MAEFTPRLGNGWTIEYSDNGTDYTAVDNVLEVVPYEAEVPEVEFQTMASTFVGCLPGLVNYKGFTFKAHYDTDRFVTLKGFHVAATSKYWRVNPPDSTANYVGQGFIKTIKLTATGNTNQIPEMDVAVRFTTAVTTS